MSKRTFSDYYTNLKYINSGTYAKVYSCDRILDNKKFAVKIISKKNLSQQQKNKIIQEIQILSKLKHKNILKIYDAFETSNNYYLILELCKGGDLFDIIKKVKNNKFSEYEAAYIIYKLTHAIKYLHSNGIVHRDLKLENILLSSTGTIKLSDFGLSSYNDVPVQTRKMKSSVGTPFYASPEILVGNEYTYKVDYWSLGVILYILLSSELPFFSENKTDLYQKIVDGDYNFTSNAWKNVSSNAKNLIKSMLNINSKKRFGAKQILSHPWILNQLKKHHSITSEIHPNVKKVIKQRKKSVKSVKTVQNPKMFNYVSF